MALRSQIEIDVIIANGQDTLGDLALKYVNRKSSGVAYGPDLKNDTYRLILLDHYLRTVIDPDTEDVRQYLIDDDVKLNKLLDGIYKLSDIFDIPGVPITGRRRLPLIFDQVGLPGTPGIEGVAGQDANIVVESDPDFDNMSIVMVVNSPTLRTFKIGYNPYSAPQASINIQGTKVKEIGVVVGVLTIIVGSIKGRQTITRREIVSPVIALTNPDLNDPGLQQENVVQNNVDSNTTYTLEVQDDAATVTTDTDTIRFVYPFLYGNSATATPSPDFYQGLTKSISVKSDKEILFNATDEYFIFGYPTSYGSLTRIRDQNLFDVTDDFEEITESVNSDNLDVDWTAVSYKFYRTKVKTTIINSTYTFEF